MVRKYGVAPYKIAVLHGGPGALGDAALLAETIGSRVGAIEPIQSQYSLDALIEELKDQLLTAGEPLACLVGHSWGSWLAGLLAARYPAFVSTLIGIGCGPQTMRCVRRQSH